MGVSVQRNRRALRALIPALLVLCSAGCGPGTDPLPRAGGSCSTAGVMRCARDGRREVREGCHHGLWALYEFCADRAHCELIDGLGPTCVSDLEPVLVPCATAKQDCRDGDPCTRDDCLGDGGCRHSPRGGEVGCDDGDACTVADHCSELEGCSGSPRNCDDGDGCTADACLPGSGCTHTPVPACQSCTLPGPDKPGSPTVTLRLMSMTPLDPGSGCDLDGDGTTESALHGAMVKLPGGAAGVNALVGAGIYMPLLRVGPAAGSAASTALRWLEGVGGQCPPSDKSCAVLASRRSYGPPAPGGTRCRPLELPATTTGQAWLRARSTEKVLPGWPRVPLAAPCTSEPPVLVRTAALNIVVGPVPAHRSPPPAGGYTVRVCGAIPLSPTLDTEVESSVTAACAAGVGGPGALQMLVHEALEPDLDLDGDGQPESVSFAFEARAEAVIFGGAK